MSCQIFIEHTWETIPLKNATICLDIQAAVVILKKEYPNFLQQIFDAIFVNHYDVHEICTQTNIMQEIDSNNIT